MNELYDEHKDHERVHSCKGCGREFCKHMKFYLHIGNIACCFCDDRLMPNPFNPVNREHFEIYCKDKKHMLE